MSNFEYHQMNRDIYDTALGILADREPGEQLFDPNSACAQAFEVARAHFRLNGVSRERIGTVAAIATIDLYNASLNIRRSSPEDFYG